MKLDLLKKIKVNRNSFIKSCHLYYSKYIFLNTFIIIKKAKHLLFLYLKVRYLLFLYLNKIFYINATFSYLQKRKFKLVL